MKTEHNGECQTCSTCKENIEQTYVVVAHVDKQVSSLDEQVTAHIADELEDHSQIKIDAAGTRADIKVIDERTRTANRLMWLILGSIVVSAAAVLWGT